MNTEQWCIRNNYLYNAFLFAPVELVLLQKFRSVLIVLIKKVFPLKIMFLLLKILFSFS